MHFLLIFWISLFIFQDFIESPVHQTSNGWERLLTKDYMDHWDTYLGPRWREDLSWEDMQNEQAIGLNSDETAVFSMVDADGESMLRISGEIWGGISTKKEYTNYHLQLSFKWGEAKHFPRATQKRDSGILYHAVGAHGADNGFWMRSQELQIQEGDCGDYWGVAGGIFDIPATLSTDSTYIYDPAGTLYTFAEQSAVGRRCRRIKNVEKPHGEWNQIDLYCLGDTAVHMVNGVVVMILYNSQQFDDGKLSPLTRGKIQLQSEGAEVFYKDIKIRPIKELPRGLK